MRPYCVGLTGGVGSGKSTVADHFASHGVEVIDTDAIARELTSAKGAAMPLIVSTFGLEFADASGAMDRSRMRELVFSDPAARHRLERILHPLIRALVERRLSQVKTPYAILVVPLLAEHLADYRNDLDCILVVDCDDTQQLRRILNRPTLSERQARAMLAAQSIREDRLAIADDVIDNRGDLSSLAAQVAVLHEKYMRVACTKQADSKTIH